MEETGKRGGYRPRAGRPKGPPTRVIRLPTDLADFARRMYERGVKPGDVGEIIGVEARSRVAVPLMLASAPCGFPSPADDYVEATIDYNDLLSPNPPATFNVRVMGESMIGAGIYPNDLAVVDCSITPYNGCIVLACLNSEFTIKRYIRRAGIVTLKAENPAFTDIIVTEAHEFSVFGVIKKSIRDHG